jgi:hypothetical protein
MGYSRDMLPLVGPVPGKKGLWSAVAFHGHGASHLFPSLPSLQGAYPDSSVSFRPSGMSRIICVTRSLAQHIQTGKWDPRLPKSFEISTERFERALAVPALTDDLDRAVEESTDGAAEVGGLVKGVEGMNV